MNLRCRIKKLLKQVKPDHKPLLIYINDSSQYVEGYCICNSQGSHDILRRVGESIEGLKIRCAAKDLELREKNVYPQEASIIFSIHEYEGGTP